MSDKAKKLYAKLSRLGYAMTTIMIYLSATSTRTLESIPGHLIGNVVQVYGWQSEQGFWDDIDLYPDKNDRHQQVDEWCYVFQQPEHMHSWMTDQEGRVLKLERKEQNYLTAFINQNTKVDVMEVYSPPRLAKRASRVGLRPGASLDLVTGWDFKVAKCLLAQRGRVQAGLCHIPFPMWRVNRGQLQGQTPRSSRSTSRTWRHRMEPNGVKIGFAAHHMPLSWKILCASSATRTSVSTWPKRRNHLDRWNSPSCRIARSKRFDKPEPRSSNL